MPGACRNLKNNFKGEVAAPVQYTNKLTAWTASPAIYMPQVLAIVDERTTTQCSIGQAPTLLSPIPDAGIFDTIPATFNSPTHFSGAGVTYSMSVVVNPTLSPPSCFTIPSIPPTAKEKRLGLYGRAITISPQMLLNKWTLFPEAAG